MPPRNMAGEPGARARLAAAGYFVVDSGQVTTAPDGEPRVVAVQRARRRLDEFAPTGQRVPAGGLLSSFRRRVEDLIGYAATLAIAPSAPGHLRHAASVAGAPA
ncbi:MAG: hypothetical protein IPH72_15990 [Sandaracinaceae bacterium]|nr:hypothetical protein [Sandaracinaceae bacterium]